MVDSPPAYGTTQVNIPVSYSACLFSFEQAKQTDALYYSTVFYQLFLDHTIVHCRSAFDPADPFTGRFNARQLGSPNPIAVVEIRKHIASLENLDATTIESLYLSANDAEAVDGNLLVNSGSGNPGSSIHTPLAVVITTVETPSKPVSPFDNILSNTDAASKVLISGLEMSHTEPHKVASVTIPLGWRAGTCTHVCRSDKYFSLFYLMSHSYSIPLQIYLHWSKPADKVGRGTSSKRCSTVGGSR